MPRGAAGGGGMPPRCSRVSRCFRCPTMKRPPCQGLSNGSLLFSSRPQQRLLIELPLNRLFALSDSPMGVGRTSRGSSLGSEWRERGAIFATTCSGRKPDCSSTDNARFLAPISGAHPQSGSRRELTTGNPLPSPRAFGGPSECVLPPCRPQPEALGPGTRVPVHGARRLRRS